MSRSPVSSPAAPAAAGGGGRHAGDLAEGSFKVDQDLEPALDEVGRRPRGAPGRGRPKPGHRVAHLGVVLHGARTKRVRARSTENCRALRRVNVGDEVALGDLGQRRGFRAEWSPGMRSASERSGCRLCAAGRRSAPTRRARRWSAPAARPMIGALVARPPAAALGITSLRVSLISAPPCRGAHEGVDLRPGPPARSPPPAVPCSAPSALTEPSPPSPVRSASTSRPRTPLRRAAPMPYGPESVCGWRTRARRRLGGEWLDPVEGDECVMALKNIKKIIILFKKKIFFKYFKFLK